jgi:hypothetical protein
MQGKVLLFFEVLRKESMSDLCKFPSFISHRDSVTFALLDEIRVSRLQPKLCRTYLLCGSEAPSLTESLSVQTVQLVNQLAQMVSVEDWPGGSMAMSEIART